MSALLATATAVAIAIGASHPEGTKTAEALSRMQRELSSLRDRIRAEVERKESSKQNEKKLLHQVERLDRRSASARRKAQAAHLDLQRLQREVADAERSVRQEEERALSFQGQAARRLEWLLTERAAGDLPRLLFAHSASFGEVARFSVKRVVASDAAAYRQARDNAKGIAGKRRELSAKRDRLVLAEAKYKRQMEDATAQRQEKDALLKRVKGEKDAATEMLKELLAASTSLQNLMSEMDRARTVPIPGARLTTLKGKLPWPAAGKVKTTFGPHKHPQFNAYVMNHGIEIACEAGAEVRSPAAGVVVFADWFRGYGQLVALDHGEGYFTVYAHLSEVAVRVNQPAPAGTLLGKAGESGSLSGPGLYFEIRRNGTAENPLHWLRK